MKVLGINPNNNEYFEENSDYVSKNLSRKLSYTLYANEGNKRFAAGHYTHGSNNLNWSYNTHTWLTYNWPGFPAKTARGPGRTLPNSIKHMESITALSSHVQNNSQN